MSNTRKLYMLRLIGRCAALVLCGVLCAAAPEQMEVLQPGKFFSRFSLLHLLWIFWVFDMLQQLVPLREGIVALGSQKLFRKRFRPAEGYDRGALRSSIRASSRRAYMIFALWAAVTAVLSWLYARRIVGAAVLFMISAAFYVCDLICVLIWCPFRLFLGNRCCTTCRIFNWDHLMMFTPMAAIGSFYSTSLLALAVLIWGIWEVSILLRPERFWERSNRALGCQACTDKLCTQYCSKKDAFSW